MQINKLILGSIVFVICACGSKESTKKQEEDKLPKFVTIDFDKIDAQKNKPKITVKDSITENNTAIQKVNRKPVEDTIIWLPTNGSMFKRMFYGKVKSSEEKMYYMQRDASGKYSKSGDVYYKKGTAFPWNFKVEFDTLGRVERTSSYSFRASENNEQIVGTGYTYNQEGQLKRIKSLDYNRYDGFYSEAGGMLFYNNKGKVKYRLAVRHNRNDWNMWTSDSTVFKYNTKGDLENSKRYHRDFKDEKFVLENDFGEPVIYKYDKKGRVIESNEERGFHKKYEYKDGKLFKLKLKYGKTDEYEYYPTGIIKIAKLRTTLSTGDYQFNETGQPEFLNGKRIATFKNYDEYGNWRTRISYNEQGVPETYTNRVIEYYE